MSLVKYDSNIIIKNTYTFFEILTLGISYILTKLLFKKAKLVCYPVYIRGKSRMDYGEGFNVGYGCRFDMINVSKSKTLFIGKNCEIGDYCHIVATNSVRIGDNFLCASKVFISDTSHGNYVGNDCSMPGSIPSKRKLYSSPVNIGSNVWLGENVVILPGVNIGNGAIVGANSVVTKDIDDNCIAVGIPARIIKKYDKNSKQWENIIKGIKK